MADMTKRYGPKKGKSVFYATAAKRKQNPGDSAVKGLKKAKPKSDNDKDDY